METLTINSPLVSIITPTYNHELFIGECIKSVLAQIYDNWEMIIVDDGSTDRTWEIVQRYAEKDKRIRAFRQENKGIWQLAETYNFALEQSRGELIAILEGDDLWPPMKLSIQVPAHVSGGYTLSFGQVQLIDALGRLISTQLYPSVNRYPFLVRENSRGLFIHLLRGEYNIPAVTVLTSKGALMKVGGFKQPQYLPVVDYPTCICVSANGGGLGFIQEVLGLWRRYYGQATSLLAGSMFPGVYRFAWEFSEQTELDLGIPSENLGQYLMGQERRRALVNTSYWAAAIAFEKGDVNKAWLYCIEIGQLAIYHLFLFIQCLAMFAWKFARKMVRRVQHSRIS